MLAFNHRFPQILTDLSSARNEQRVPAAPRPASGQRAPQRHAREPPAVSIREIRDIPLKCAAVELLSAASDPNVGTWKLNAEKLKGAIVKSGTVVIEPAGDGVKVIVDLVANDGTPAKWSFTAGYDGKDSPVTGNSPFGNTVAMTRVDDHTTKVTSKQDGKATVEQTVVVSADGKTRTLTSKGTDTKGNPIDSTTVYDRQ